MLNQVIGQEVGAKLLGYHRLPFNWYCYLSCETFWSSTKGTPVLIHRQWHPSAQRIQVHCGEAQHLEKPLCTPESSQDPRCSWGNDSSITAGWNGRLRLPWFCSRCKTYPPFQGLSLRLSPKEETGQVFFFFFTTLLSSASLFTSMKFEPEVRWVVE